MEDIQGRADIERLVQVFYEKVMEEPELSSFFGKVVPIDWEHHLPRMVGFWEFILFQTPHVYTGNVMNPHLALTQKKEVYKEHFDKWLSLFNTTVDQLFAGPVAEQAKNAAFSIGMTMEYKIRAERKKAE